jgi:PIN domain nuclease of toxin-antitoxin system
LNTLLDTHVLFWWLTDDARLSTAARHILTADDTTVHVSVVTAWEITIKVGLGKWPEAEELIKNFESEVASEGFRILPIDIRHARLAGLMRTAHRDPFDRMLAAQAMSEGLELVTSDQQLAALGANCVW